MNKYEKAFDVIDTILHLMCGEEREDGYKPSHDEMVNSMENFKELVERATPKRPFDIKNENKKCIGGNPLYGEFITGICPVCKRDVQLGMNYCPECGKALDWRIEDEKNT